MQQESQTTMILNRLKEIGALLLLLCLWLVLLQPYGALNQYGSTNYTQFLSVDFLYIVITILMAAFGFVLGFSLLSKSPNAILLAQVYFTLSFINQAAWVTYFIDSTGFKEAFTSYSPEDILKMIVCPPLSIAWLIYFTKSTRVQSLYGTGTGSNSYAVEPALSPTSSPVPCPDKPLYETNAHRGSQEATIDSLSGLQATLNEKDIPRAIISESPNENENNKNQRRENMQSDTTSTTQSTGTPKTGTGRIVEVNEKYNVGIVLRIIGIFLLFVFPIGTIAGVGLIIAGWKMSKKYSCSECGYPLSNKNVKFCSTCNTTLSPFQPLKKTAS